MQGKICDILTPASYEVSMPTSASEDDVAGPGVQLQPTRRNFVDVQDGADGEVDVEQLASVERCLEVVDHPAVGPGLDHHH